MVRISSAIKGSEQVPSEDTTVIARTVFLLSRATAPQPTASRSLCSSRTPSATTPSGPTRPNRFDHSGYLQPDGRSGAFMGQSCCTGAPGSGCRGIRACPCSTAARTGGQIRPDLIRSGWARTVRRPTPLLRQPAAISARPPAVYRLCHLPNPHASPLSGSRDLLTGRFVVHATSQRPGPFLGCFCHGAGSGDRTNLVIGLPHLKPSLPSECSRLGFHLK